MELMKNIKLICRVCGANTKRRRQNTDTSAAYCIFSTPNLRNKLQKYLLLKIDIGDQLPTTICSYCYRKVQSIDAFAATAKKTENFLNDFIRISRNNLQSSSTASTHFQHEFNAYAMLAASQAETSNVILCDDILSDPEDVILNVSLNDPLTRDIGKKIFQAKRKKVSSDDRGSSGSSGVPFSLRNNFIASAPARPRKVEKKRRPASITRTLEEKRQNLKAVLSSVSANESFAERTLGQTTVKPVLVPSTPECSKTPLSPVASSSSGVQISVRHFAKEPTMAQMPHFQTMNDCLNLGSVIKDLDLLKLILKALKWPFNEITLPAQIQRLKSTRFRDVMVDPNLLQDTDMMQILSSYLGPILQQSQAPLMTPPPLTPIAPLQPILPPCIAYKLPAETSIQVIHVPRDDDPQSHHVHDHHHAHNQRPRPQLPKKKKKRLKPPRTNPEVIVVSDESDFEPMADGVQNFEVSIDPMLFLAQMESSNESMLGDLNRVQRKRLTNKNDTKRPVQKQRRRKQSYSMVNLDTRSIIIDVDDDTEIIPINQKRKNPLADKVCNAEPIVPMQTEEEAGVSTTDMGHLTYLGLKRRTLDETAQSTSSLREAGPSPTKVPPSQKVEEVPEIPSVEVESSEDVDDEPRLVIDDADVEDDISNDIWSDFTLSTPQTTEKSPRKEESVVPVVIPQDDIQEKTFADADSTTKHINRESTHSDHALDTTGDLEAEEQIGTIGDSVVEEKVEGTALVQLSDADTSHEEQKDDASTAVEEEARADEAEKVQKPEEMVSEKEQKEKSEEFTKVESILMKEEERNIKTAKKDTDSQVTEVRKTRAGRKPKAKPDASAEMKQQEKAIAGAADKGNVSTRLSRRRQGEVEKLELEVVKKELNVAKTEPNVTTRPARRSKTFSKYYKGPPTESKSTTTGNATRSTTRKKT